MEDKSTATTPFYYVWFNVIATREGLVGQTTARGHVLVSNDHFVALPATDLCIVGVRLRNANNAEDTTVLDVGPWCPNTPVPGRFNQYNCSSDGYWNTFGVPFAATASCATTHAGIDLVDATFANLGLTGNGNLLEVSMKACRLTLGEPHHGARRCHVRRPEEANRGSIFVSSARNTNR